MILVYFLAALVATSSPPLERLFVFPSVPPMQSPPDGLAIGDAMRKLCMSDQGVAIVVDDALRHQSAEILTKRAQESHALEIELGEAAFADPINVERLERAIRAKDEHQALWMTDVTTRSMALIRRLPPDDQKIYARRLTMMQPRYPAKRCDVPKR